MQTRKQFLGAFGATILGGSVKRSLAMAQPSAMNTAPNVVLVLTDDQGYGDLGCLGNPIIQTPNMDAFCKQSVRLTCHDWHGGDLPPWDQTHIFKGQHANGFWAVEVARAGEYEFSLRRWPKEADQPITAAIPGEQGPAGDWRGRSHRPCLQRGKGSHLPDPVEARPDDVADVADRRGRHLARSVLCLRPTHSDSRKLSGVADRNVRMQERKNGTLEYCNVRECE